MLSGMMMNRPLSISAILDYAAEVYCDGEVVSAGVEGNILRQSYRETRSRVMRLANAMRDMGVQPGDRIATLAWNGHRHLELYYAISGIGAVCHTINPRLFPDQIAWIINHANDQALFFDSDLAGLANNLAPNLPKSIRFVALCDRSNIPTDGPEGTLAYEELIGEHLDVFEWPELPEDTASGLCYTSGTTGHPKGVLYSHRSTVLHAMSVVLAAASSFGTGHRILPVVPLFHVNAWGLPFTAPLSGTDLVMPGPKLDGRSLFDLMEREDVTAAWGVPTVWSGLIDEMRRQGKKPSALNTLLIGGSAVGEAQIRALEVEFGVKVLHGWGMTEMSPVGSVTRPTTVGLTPEAEITEKLKQGRRLFGVELKIIDDAGKPCPQDDLAAGELLVRGNSVVAGYFNDDAATESAFDNAGWFRTGDVARISESGDLTIVDRSKDLIKSGGEWISSIDLENAACSCPGVRQAAAIAIKHEKWGERPLLAVVCEAQVDISAEQIIEHLAASMAKWQLPHDVIFLDSLPMTATGKVSKLELRRQLQDDMIVDD